MQSTQLFALLVGLLIGVIVGAIAVWFVGRARASAGEADARAETHRALQLASDARAETDRVRAELAQRGLTDARGQTAIAEAGLRAEQARAEAAEVRAQLAAATSERDNAVARADELARDRDSLAAQFKLLSTEALERQSRPADVSAEARLRATEAVLVPVKESLQLLNQRLTDVEKERSEIAAQLREQVQSVQTTGENLRRETNALVTALRKPQVRGAWGETQLKRVVEITGMVERVDFDLQVSMTTDDGGLRPDMRVNLADGKCLFVDSKVPLSAFLDAYESDDETIRAQHLTSFARTVRHHIDQLSGKNYWKLGDSPEMVVLFLPSEAFLQAAVEQQPDLQEYAVSRNIVLATPSILIPLLRAVQHGWQQAALAQNAAQVLALGRELYDRLCSLGSNFDKVGRSLTTAVKSYNAAIGSMESRVMVSARRMRDLKVTTVELSQLSGIDEPVRQLAAAELLEDAGQIDTIIGLERAGLTRGEPTSEELVAEQEPTESDRVLRQLR